MPAPRAEGKRRSAPVRYAGATRARQAQVHAHQVGGQIGLPGFDMVEHPQMFFQRLPHPEIVVPPAGPESWRSPWCAMSDSVTNWFPAERAISR